MSARGHAQQDELRTHGEDGIAALQATSEEGHDVEGIVGESPTEQVAQKGDEGLQHGEGG